MRKLFSISVVMVMTCLAACAQRPALGDTLTGRLFVGYQGWYGCPGDYGDNKDWQYWFPNGPSTDRIFTDTLPSTTHLDPKHLCDTGLARVDGKGTVKLFSSQDPAVVLKHFEWMREANIDGVALQRFVFTLYDPVKKARADHLLANAISAAERTGRSLYICYDISGANAATVTDDIRKDWTHLVNDFHVTGSPAYLYDHRRPVLELWGFGLADRPGSVEKTQQLINDLKSGKSGLPSATLIGGVTGNWRTLGKGSKAEPGWAEIYRSFDVISPWSIGPFNTDEGFESFFHNVEEPDITEAHQLGIRYMPVVFPGYSHYNAAIFHGRSAPFNQDPRNCGRFFWKQLTTVQKANVDSIYIAMFDEVGEGTAIFPLAARHDDTIAGAKMLALDQDGCQLPDDWYLRVTGAFAQFLHHGQIAPPLLDEVLKP